MSVLKAILAELIALFVDDGLLVAAAMIWVALIGLVAPFIAVPPEWRGLLLFLGLAVILIESVIRRSRSS